MAPRELVIETEMSADELQRALKAALTEHEILVITDKRGGTVLIPGEKIAYVELDQARPRAVGFGT